MSPTLHTHTRDATIIQHGVYFDLALLWSEGTHDVAHPAVGDSWLGIRYQLWDDPDAERTRIRSLTLDLTTAPVGVPANLGQVWVGMHDTLDSNTFGAAGYVPPDCEQVAAGLVDEWILVGYDDGTGWSNPTPPATLSIPLGVATIEPVANVTWYDLSTMNRVLEMCGASGEMNLGITIESPFQFTTVNTTLEVTELDFFTGVAGSKGRERGDSRVRIVRDSRFGMPVWTDRLVEDGDQPGYWVLPEHSDPEDPEREYTGNPREGTRDDDVPLT